MAPTSGGSYVGDTHRPGAPWVVSGQFKPLDLHGKRLSTVFFSIFFSQWKILIRICEDNNFILNSIELPMDSSDAMIGLTQEAIIKTLTSYINLDEFMKPFIKE